MPLTLDFYDLSNIENKSRGRPRAKGKERKRLKKQLSHTISCLVYTRGEGVHEKAVPTAKYCILIGFSSEQS